MVMYQFSPDRPSTEVANLTKSAFNFNKSHTVIPVVQNSTTFF